ncbi:MAG: ThiF family adenylyltransferase [Acidimicrobiales bacterium]
MSLPIEISEESRYDRQERISWWDQQVLAEAKILVVGAGALGNEVVKNLVLMGVGSIVVIDFDTVEMSNLARCVLLRESDNGRSKAVAVAERAGELNGAVEVVGIQADLRALGTGLGRRADVMVGALDNREARLHLNRLAWQASRPWVDGAIEGLHGVGRVFSPPDSCYECTLTEEDFGALAHRQSCRLLSPEDLVEGKVPTCVPTASIVAGVQAQEVVKLLHAGRPGVNPLCGAMVFDGVNNDAYPLRYPVDDDCLAHHPYVDPMVLERDDALTFERVAESVGLPSGTVELFDDLIIEWSCPSCETTSPARSQVRTAGAGDARCPECDRYRQPATTTTITPASPLWTQSIESAGVCADDLLAIRSGSAYRYAWPKHALSDLPASWS